MRSRGASSASEVAVPIVPRLETTHIRHAHADAETVAEFLSRTGYDLPVAVADLIDNAIDAGANRIEVSLVLEHGRPTMLAIADNGRGMNGDELERAVSLEKDPRKQDGRSLGRYGAGLKAASFSLGRVLNIVTRTLDGAAIGARLDQAEYSRNYEYRLLAENVAEALMATPWGGRPLGPSGTVILISDLAAMVPRSDTSQDLFLEGFGRDLDVRVGLIFHRFIQSGRIEIGKSKRTLGAFSDEFDRYLVSAIDPFGYPQSGHAKYPQLLQVDTGHFDVPVTLHLWPKQGRTKATRNQFYEILGRSSE